MSSIPNNKQHKIFEWDKQEEEKNIIKRMGIEKGKKGGTLIKGGKG